jgi:hypothetical protein
LQVSLKKAEVKDLPWSVTKIEPVPYLAEIYVALDLAQVSVVESEMGMASTKLEKW